MTEIEMSNVSKYMLTNERTNERTGTHKIFRVLYRVDNYYCYLSSFSWVFLFLLFILSQFLSLARSFYSILLPPCVRLMGTHFWHCSTHSKILVSYTCMVNFFVWQSSVSGSKSYLWEMSDERIKLIWMIKTICEQCIQIFCWYENVMRFKYFSVIRISMRGNETMHTEKKAKRRINIHHWNCILLKKWRRKSLQNNSLSVTHDWIIYINDVDLFLHFYFCFVCVIVYSLLSSSLSSCRSPTPHCVVLAHFLSLCVFCHSFVFWFWSSFDVANWQKM